MRIENGQSCGGHTWMGWGYPKITVMISVHRIKTTLQKQDRQITIDQDPEQL